MTERNKVWANGVGTVIISSKGGFVKLLAESQGKLTSDTGGTYHFVIKAV